MFPENGVTHCRHTQMHFLDSIGSVGILQSHTAYLAA